MSSINSGEAMALSGATLRIPALAGIGWKVTQVKFFGSHVPKGQPKKRPASVVVETLEHRHRSVMRWEELAPMIAQGDIVIEPAANIERGVTKVIKKEIEAALESAEGRRVSCVSA